MHRLLSVCPSVQVIRKNSPEKKWTRKKSLKQFISQQPLNLGSWNFVSTLMWMTPRSLEDQGQRSRSPGQKVWICSIYTGHTIKKYENHIFQLGDLDFWPMTMTFRSILIPNFKVSFLSQSVWQLESWITDTHTHKRDQFYTLNHWSRREWPWPYEIPRICI